MHTINFYSKSFFFILLSIFMFTPSSLVLGKDLIYNNIIKDQVGGRVIDIENKGVVGVTVIVKESNKGVVTDENGNFSIEIEMGQTLVVSSVGFQTKEIVYNGKSTIERIVLLSSSLELDEFVAIGFGKKKKSNITSAIENVSGAELVKRPVNSIQQAMQGKVPGMTVIDKGGAPGEPNNHIIIRGVSRPYRAEGLGGGQLSTIGDNGPLVIVDGVEQPFQNINPEDIESISILKDASSTAIYGSRAGNGVILIETKRPDLENIMVSYGGYYGWQKAISKPQHMKIEDYIELERAAYSNVGSDFAYPYGDNDYQKYIEGTKNDPLRFPLPFDWYNTMLKTAPQYSHSLSVAGGGKTIVSRLSLRFKNTDGIISNVDSKLSEMRLNNRIYVSPKIDIDADLNYRYESNIQPHDMTEIFRQFMQNSIWDVPKYPNGDYGGGAQGNNPLLLAENGGINRNRSSYFMLNLKGKWEIAKGLKFESRFASRITNVNIKDFQNTWETKDDDKIVKRNIHNKLIETRNDVRQTQINNLLTYSKSLGENNFEILLGYSQIENVQANLTASRQDFYNNDIQSINQGAEDGTQSNGGNDAKWGLRSYFGRVDYSFRDKYLIEVNGRYDGSSRFVGANRYSFFPSFSGGWRISQEGFWKEGAVKNVIEELKIRGSWGKSGNQTIPLYSYFANLNQVNYSFNDALVRGFVQQEFADSSISWETQKQIDLGLDVEFMKGGFAITVDFYNKITNGILLTLPVPGILGLNPGVKNAGTVRNRGWEFTLNNRNSIGELFMSTALNLSINNNKVIDLSNTGPYIQGTDIDPRYITEVGLPINSFWGYKTDGLFQSDEDASDYPEFMRPAKAGDVKVLDLNGDGKITPSDMTYLGNSFPKYTFGANFNLNYRNFTLSFLFQGAAKVGMRYARALAEAGNYEGFTPDIYTDNYWTPENRDAYFARPTKRDLRNQASTDRMVLDASYLRLKNIQVGYNFPDKVLERTFIKNLRVYVSATNLFTFSELNKWHLDPESPSGWQNIYPQTGLYTIGVNVNF